MLLIIFHKIIAFILLFLIYYCLSINTITFLILVVSGQFTEQSIHPMMFVI